MFPVDLPVCPPFLPSVSLRPLDDEPGILLLDARFAPEHFDESLFQQLGIPAPDRLRQALRKRRAEYLASRYLVQQALATFGVHNFVLHNDSARAPQWPDGVCGSLSHSHDRVCALLTRRSDRLLGIDCEQVMANATAQEMAEMIVTPAEQQRLSGLQRPFEQLLTAVFSVKESLYKAVWPQLGQFMTFSDAEVVAVSEACQRMTLRLTRGWSAAFYEGRTFHARLQWQPGAVMSVVTAPGDRRLTD